MKKTEAEIIADSINPQGDRITTYLLTFPRFILAELNTHRVFSKNSASSRAIPFEKMVRMVEDDPFIPIAWQKDHKGMQGTEYLSKTDKFNLSQFVSVMIDTLNNMTDRSSKDFKQFEKEVEERVNLITGLLSKYTHFTMTLDEWWLLARDKAVEAASILYVFRVTKQLCNRLLEPFMWHTVLLTGTEFENFFKLRCPLYQTPVSQTVEPQYSWKDLMEVHSNPVNLDLLEKNKDNYAFKFQHSKSSAEIHIQALAEAMWDAMNESTPKELEEGEWHIPFGDKILDNNLEILLDDNDPFNDGITSKRDSLKVRISTARCARLSYMTFDGKVDYEKDIKLHDTLLESQHMSPFEHCAKAMGRDYDTFIKGELTLEKVSQNFQHYKMDREDRRNIGWCNNYKGFIQYRYLIENDIIKRSK